MNEIYLTNIRALKNKNEEIERHLELLYDKMAKVIKWNRSLKKQKQKCELESRILDYRISSYSSALEEVTNMLLTETKETNCLHLAKKILKKLHKEKNNKKEEQ